jgi:hypothetical protein
MKNNLNEFRLDNTDGFSEDELNVMNYELAELLDEQGFEEFSEIDPETVKHFSGIVFNSHFIF